MRVPPSPACRTSTHIAHWPRREPRVLMSAQFPDVAVSVSLTALTEEPSILTLRKELMTMLKDKVAVIYGAGGAIGSAVARAFAHEGAKLFLTGCHRAPVE